MIPTFFGLKATDKPLLHDQLFEMVYYGKGFTWTELYNMPTWLRKFYYRKQVEAIQPKENKNASGKKPKKK